MRRQGAVRWWLVAVLVAASPISAGKSDGRGQLLRQLIFNAFKDEVFGARPIARTIGFRILGVLGARGV